MWVIIFLISGGFLKINLEQICISDVLVVIFFCVVIIELMLFMLMIGKWLFSLVESIWIILVFFNCNG